MRIPPSIPSLVLLLLVWSCSAPDDRPVATADGEEISVGEFRERFRIFLKASGVRDNYETRRQVINNMANEILVMRDLKERGWFEAPSTKRRLREIENQALLDAFAKFVIYDTVKVSEAELQEEFRRWNTKTSARYLYAETLEDAHDLKARVERGETFEALAREVFRDPGLATNGGSVGFFGKGEMDPAFEGAAMNLEVGEVSDPVKIGIGYAVIRVDERKLVPLLSEADYAKQKGEIESSVRTRKNNQALADVSEIVSQELNPTFNEPVVSEMFASWADLIQPQQIDEVGETGQMVSFKDSVIVRFGNDAWTASDVLSRLPELTQRQKGRVRSADDLKRAIAGLAARDELIERAKDHGLEDHPEVSRQALSVTLQLALKEWSRQLEDSVRALPADETLILRIFRENLDRFLVPPQVNVAEILLRTRAEADEVSASLRSGGDFARLARARSLRLWAAKQGGELGFKDVAEYGALSDKFSRAPVGAVLGPEFVDPYYGLFKILGKRKSRPMTPAEARPQIVEGLRRQQLNEVVTASIESLRRRYIVTIDDTLLQSIPLVNHDS